MVDSAKPWFAKGSQVSWWKELEENARGTWMSYGTFGSSDCYLSRRVYEDHPSPQSLGSVSPVRYTLRAGVDQGTGGLSISDGSYLNGRGSVVGRAEDLRVGQIVQLATQSSQMSISRAFYQYNIALLVKTISFLDNTMTTYNEFSQSEE